MFKTRAPMETVGTCNHFYCDTCIYSYIPQSKSNIPINLSHTLLEIHSFLSLHLSLFLFLRDTCSKEDRHRKKRDVIHHGSEHGSCELQLDVWGHVLGGGGPTCIE